MKKGYIVEINKNSYEIIKSIGNGGSGKVYEVENDSNHFALKIIESTDQEKITRFINECEFMSKTNNRHILKCLDYGKLVISGAKNGEQESLYCLMPLYPKNLRILMKNDLTIYQRLRICSQLCKALKIIHKKGIIHRDIKPENILIDDKNNAILADFGISHFVDHAITKKGKKLANFDYHAPEQSLLNAEAKIGSHTDIYALGLIFNEIFTGKVMNGNTYELIGNKYPLFSELDDLVYKMTSQDPMNRLNDINIVISELDLIMFSAKEKLTEIKQGLFTNSYVARVSRKDLKMIIDIAAIDILYGKNLFYRDIKKLNSINVNYNMKIGYRVSDFILNLAIQEGFLDICSRKFQYESSVYKKGKNNYRSLNFDDYKQLELYKEMIQIVNDYPVDDNYDLSGKILHFFSSCQDYHCREIISECKEIPKKCKDNLEDAPILWILTRLAYYLKESYNKFLKDDYELQFDISINWDRTRESFFKNENFGLIDEFEMKRSARNEKILFLLKEKYPRMMYVYDKSNHSAKIFFPKYRYYNTFKIDSLKTAKPNYIFEGDVLDMLRVVRQSNNTIELDFSFFEIETIIPKLLRQEP